MKTIFGIGFGITFSTVHSYTHCIKLYFFIIITRVPCSQERKFYNLWGSTAAEDEEQKLRGVHKHIPAPRRPLPAHAESYNPPPEYLLDSKEV